MDTICSTAFGIQIDSQSNPKNPTVVHANAVMGNVPPSWTQKLKMFFVGLIIRKFQVNIDSLQLTISHMELYLF